MAFLLIGLCGGALASREAVAAMLVDEASRNVGAYSSAHVAAGRVERSGAHEDLRLRRLRVFLEGVPELAKASPEGALVVTHVLTQPEADELRRAGGVLWHLVDPVSSLVPIRLGDLQVTHKAGGDRHRFGPLEALSVELLRRSRKDGASA